MINPYIYLEKDDYNFFEMFDLNNLEESYYKVVELYGDNVALVGFKILKDPYFSILYKNNRSINLLYQSGFFIDDVPINYNKHKNITFVTSNLDKIICNKSKSNKKLKNIVLISTGGFSPVHDGHISLFEQAHEYLKNDFNILGWFLSPSHDLYVDNKYNGTAKMHIEKRNFLIQELCIDHPYLELEQFEANFCEYELNFTEVVDRFKKYIQFYLNEDIEVCYVFGSDNYYFYNAFLNKGLSCCIERPNKKISEPFISDNNYYLPSKFEENISSSEIRKNFLFQNKNYPASYHYGIRDDGLQSLPVYSNMSKYKYNLFLNKFISILKEYLPNNPNIELISLKKQKKYIKDFELKNTISCDIHIKGNYNLEISRLFKITNIQNKPIKVVQRKNKLFPNIPEGNYTLIEDDTVSGNTIKLINNLLNPKNVFIDNYIFLTRINNKDFFDVIDIRDFIIGANNSGLYVSFFNEYIRVPYLEPYVNLNSRANIILGKQKEFSKKIYQLNKEFYSSLNKNIKLKDLSSDFQILMLKQGFSLNDYILNILDYHINML